jgi:predicted enzyme related to lactoylglutathione lyase
VIKQIQDFGGEIIQEKMPIQGVGWFAQFKDTEGNALGIMQDDPSAK